MLSKKEQNERQYNNQNGGKKVIKGYVFLDVLGKGSFGEVFMARNNKNGGTYAIKVIQKELVRRKKLQEYVQNEIKIMLELDSDHIVKLYDHFEDREYLYMVLEYCEGGTLYKYVLDKNPGRDECLRIFAQILRGFRAIHEKQFLHRDLKPDNIFIKNNIFKIADFGLSKDQGLGSTYCGTSFFMAPEILKHQTHDYKADLWSLGVILFFMLFHIYPFKNRLALLSEIEQATEPYFTLLMHLKKKWQRDRTDADIMNLFEKIFVMSPQKRISFEQLYQLKIFDGLIDIQERDSTRQMYRIIQGLGTIRNTGSNQAVTEQEKFSDLETPPEFNDQQPQKMDLKVMIQIIMTQKLIFYNKIVSLENALVAERSRRLSLQQMLVGNPQTADKIDHKILSKEDQKPKPIKKYSHKKQLKSRDYDIDDDDIASESTAKRKMAQFHPLVKPDIMLHYADGCRNFKPETPVLPPSKANLVEDIFQAVPEYREDEEEKERQQEDEQNSLTSHTNLSVFAHSVRSDAYKEAIEQNFQQQCARYLFEVGKYSVLMETVEEMRNLQIGPSSRALVNYILSKQILFFGTRLVNSIKQNINVLFLPNFAEFVNSQSANFISERIQKDLDFWAPKFQLFYYGINELDIKSNTVKQILTESLVETDFDLQLKLPSIVVLKMCLKASYQQAMRSTQENKRQLQMHASLRLALSCFLTDIFVEEKLERFFPEFTVDNKHFEFWEFHQWIQSLDFETCRRILLRSIAQFIPDKEYQQIELFR